MALPLEYEARFNDVLGELATSIENYLRDILRGEDRVDRISARPKSISRFLEKALKIDDQRPKYTAPLHQIQDQVGARIICFYLRDVDRISEIVERYIRRVEKKTVVPENEAEFGYFGKHYVLLVPADVINPAWPKDLVPEFFELQIKTLFQHAWSEADHDLGYRPGLVELTPDQKRRVAFTAAQAWGADRLFDELFRERGQS